MNSFHTYMPLPLFTLAYMADARHLSTNMFLVLAEVLSFWGVEKSKQTFITWNIDIQDRGHRDTLVNKSIANLFHHLHEI